MTRQSFLAVLIVIALLSPRVEAEPSPVDPGKQKRDFLATLIKERLDEDLAKTEFKPSASGRHTIRIPNPISDIVVHTDWSVTGSGRFVEPAKRSTVDVTRLERQADGSTLVTLVAAAPIAGDLWGEIRNLGKTKVDFSSKTRLELRGRLKKKPGKAGAEGEFEAEILDWKGTFENVDIRPDFAGILAREARQAANKALAEKNEELKAQANRALARAASDGRLRLDP